MSITKKEVLDNLETVKKFITEIDGEQAKPKGIVLYKRDGTVLANTDKPTVKEAAVNNKANLYGADLRGANLREADLREADLREADLRGADLYGANLCEANLREANLCGANLRGADLRGANLRGAELNCAKFYGKGGTTRIKKSQVDDFFKALGVIVEE